MRRKVRPFSTNLSRYATNHASNKPIVEVVWPASLQQVSFGYHFNHSIVRVVRPAALQELHFGNNFNSGLSQEFSGRISCSNFRPESYSTSP